MNIDLVKADLKHKELVSNLLQLYLYEFTVMEDNDVRENGRFQYKYLDNYWIEPTRHPFLIKVDGKWVGFVFVDEKDTLAEPDYPQGITEFFVMRKYRHKGIGEEAAQRIFMRFAGRWSIREMEENKEAQEFWRKIIRKFTNGEFEEIPSNDKWKGPIQLFDSSNIA